MRRSDLDGDETFDISGITELNEGRTPRTVKVTATKPAGEVVEFDAVVRIDTPGEADYYRNGGIMQYVLRSLARRLGLSRPEGSALMPKVSPDRLRARRQQILDGARACFARHGYEGATVRVLEEEIGLSRGAIFHHFADKEALFLAVAEQDAAAMRQTVAEHGLVQVMREMIAAPDAERIGTQLEIARRLRTDPGVPDGLAAPAR